MRNDGEAEIQSISDKCTPCYLNTDRACMLSPYSRQFCLGPFSDHSDRMAKIEAMRKEDDESHEEELKRAIWRHKRSLYKENLMIFETLMKPKKED